jgi:hypothetical protein
MWKARRMSNTRKINGTALKPKPDLRSLIKTAKLAERHVSICLRGDLYADIQRLDAELRAILADTATDGRLAGNAAAQRKKAEIEAAQAEMQENTTDFRLRALPRPDWTELRAAHPPRDGEERDLNHRVNIDTFVAALLPRSIVDPPMDDDLWAELEPVLSDKQYEDLASAAFAANLGDSNVPFSPAVSALMRTSGSESKRQSDSASPSDDSTDGNPAP